MGPVILLAAACEGLTPPIREDGYPFALVFTGEVFHWPAARLPVRYWVVPNAGDLPEYVRGGIVTWRDQLLYGEFDGVLVDDSATADVVITVPSPPPGAPVTDDVPDPGACTGQTEFFIIDTDAGARIEDQFVVALSWNALFSDSQIANCLYRVVRHEVGHTLGIFRHSAAAEDLMANNPIARDPTLQDRRTVERLYHTPATIAPAPR